MNTVLFDLQAAVMAASVSGGNSSLTEIPEDGSSFSDVLAAQKELVTDSSVNQATDRGEVDAAMPEDDAEQDYSAVLEAIENADENMKKALLKLLQTVLKAFRGSDDDKERATDLFALFSDGGAGMAEDEDDMLLGCELLNRTGLMIEAELYEGTSAEEIIAELEDTIVKILGEDTDETTAAELMASLLDTSAVQADGDDLMSAAELLKSAKQAVCEVNPEDAERMEQLFADIKDISYSKTEAVPEFFRLNFTSVKINNASEQVAAIGNDEVNPELMTDIKPEIIVDKSVVTETTAESIQVQVTEAVTEKLVNMKTDGVEELTMILKPENLGEVAVKLIRENGAVTVLISAQYDEVGKAMADRAAALTSSLQNQNYNVKEVLVVAAGNAAEQMGLDFTNQGFNFAQNRGGNQNSDSGYRRIEGIDGIEETEAITGAAKLKEAKLWTTA